MSKTSSQHKNFRLICPWGVALPQFADVLGIFLLRQAMRGIPKALIEAARMEGIGSLKIMRDIILPLVRPSILTTGIIFFINSWNEIGRASCRERV